ncbi:hypothetical protein B296_00058170 [Ensete ventricosum]|uniref:Uncharacterized protein n=1 Tax=Ensete ventricosum TaxID=4639 RepID=A0A426XN81_ENSVE|nr:hypothetical protein B296_00058170 [Ensete ventricosum]
MASVDMIGAKLEAFEMRMEDRLRALFTEFRLGRSPSPRRSQRDENVKSRDHRCKRGKLLVIESIEDLEPEDVDPKPEREDAEEEPQPTIGTIHALAGYANPQYMKVDGFLEHQPITIHIDTGSTNNFMDGKIRKPQRRRELIRHRQRNNPPIDQGIREDGDKPSDSTANRVSPESPKVRNNKRKKSKSVSLARQSPQRNSDEGAKMRRRGQKSRA